MSAGLVRILIELAVLIAIGAGVYFERQLFGTARYEAGYNQASSEAAAEAGKRDRENALEKAAHEKRIADAYRAKNEIEAQLAVIRARPVPRLVCRRAEDARSADELPTAAGLPEAEAPRAGALPQGTAQGARSFDPGPGLTALVDEADDLLEQCRLLHNAVHGPTAVH